MVKDKPESVAVVGSSRVMVVCLVTVTVESLGIVCVTPESVLDGDVLDGGGGGEDDEEERLAKVELAESEAYVLLASPVVTVAEAGGCVGSADMVEFRIDDDDVVGILASSSPGQTGRLQGSTEQQPANPLEQRYHWVFVGQTGKPCAYTSFILSF